MSALEAARLGDQIGHTSAMKGLIAGLVVGFIVTGVILLAVGATVATGGAAAVVIGALVAGTAGGGLAGMKIGATIDSDPKGPISSGSPNTFLGTGRKPAARAVIDTVACGDHATKLIAQGSTNVFINEQPAARRTDMTKCSGKIREGQPDVFFGGPTGTYMEMDAEVPGWLVSTLEWAALLGAVVATGGAILTVGLGAALGGLAGSMALGWVGGKIGGAIGARFGATGEAIGEVAGGFLGSIWGGGLGARAGNAALARLPGATRPQITARMNVARDYMAKSPDYQPKSRSPADIKAARARVSDQMSGTDFSKPVRVRTLRQDTHYDQYQNAGSRGPGNFIAKAGTKPTEIGLGSTGRSYVNGDVGPKQVVTYKVPAGTRVLESTAAAKVDFWSAGNGPVKTGGFYEPVLQPSVGGGQQTLIGNTKVMVPKGPATNANPALLEPGTPTTFTPGKVVPTQAANPPGSSIEGGAVNFGKPSQAIGVGVGTAGGVGPDPDQGRRGTP